MPSTSPLASHWIGADEAVARFPVRPHEPREATEKERHRRPKRPQKNRGPAKSRKTKALYTQAGPVTIRTSDGQSRTEPAYDYQTFQKLIRN